MSIGESKAALAAAGGWAKDAGAIEARVAADLGTVSETFDSANQAVGAALANLFAATTATDAALDGLRVSHKGVHGEVGTVKERVEGSVQEPLKTARQTLLSEDGETKRQRGEAVTVGDVIKMVLGALVSAKTILEQSTSLAAQASADAERSAAKQIDVGANVIKIASTF